MDPHKVTGYQVMYRTILQYSSTGLSPSVTIKCSYSVKHHTSVHHKDPLAKFLCHLEREQDLLILLYLCIGGRVLYA